MYLLWRLRRLFGGAAPVAPAVNRLHDAVVSDSPEALQAEYQALLARLRPFRPRYTAHHQLQMRATHEGSAHVERVDGHYHYVVTERGSELQRRSARDRDELLYWLLCDATAGIAQAHEARHRKQGEDSRRAWMALQLDLLDSLDPAWAERKRAEYDALLLRYPFRDGHG